MKFKQLPVFVAILSACFISCSKAKDGEPGPPGSANVTAFKFTSPAWSANLININLPALTQGIMDSGLVVAYMKFASLNTVYYHVPGLVVNSAYTIRVYHQVGGMRFNIHNPDGSALAGTPPAVADIKVILIPAATSVNGRGMSPQTAILNELREAGVNIEDYEAVRRYYHLPD